MNTPSFQIRICCPKCKRMGAAMGNARSCPKCQCEFQALAAGEQPVEVPALLKRIEKLELDNARLQGHIEKLEDEEARRFRAALPSLSVASVQAHPLPPLYRHHLDDDGQTAFRPLDEVEAGAVADVATIVEGRCLTCTSPSPELHPAMQFEGEVQPCKDSFHASAREPVQ